MRITNLTDHPDQQSLLINIYNVVLTPGEGAEIGHDMINDKIFSLVDAGYLSLGQLPEYYVAWKYPTPLPPVPETKKIEEPEIVEVIEPEKPKTKKK